MKEQNPEKDLHNLRLSGIHEWAELPGCWKLRLTVRWESCTVYRLLKHTFLLAVVQTCGFGLELLNPSVGTVLKIQMHRCSLAEWDSFERLTPHM